jgi:hypothetical protein
MRRVRAAVILSVAVLVAGVALVVVGVVRGRSTTRADAAWTVPTTTAASAAPVGGCPGPWDCAFSARLAAASALVAAKPGRLGIAVRDRVSGAVWRAGEPEHPVWTASTIKLALAVDLLERARVGSLTLDATARQQIADMLDFSSNSAADRLWRRFELADRVQHYRDVYGISGLEFPAGYRYWGAMKCTTDGLLGLMSYVLDHLAPADRDYIVGAMRTVDRIQQWGVWAAGRSQRPGLKAGWSIEKDPGGEHWVANSVGFAGPDARYAIAVMYQLPPGVNTRNGSIRAGVHAISDIVATIFGAPVPAPVTVPPNDL